MDRVESIESVETPESTHNLDESFDLSQQKTAQSGKIGRNSSSNQSVTNEAKQTRLQQLWAKTGLDTPTIILMLKAGISPTIALAMYQSITVADEFTTIGYLIAIASVIAFPIIPRAKYLQALAINVFAICLASAILLFALWTVIKARENTTDPNAPISEYNSSASAVCAIWLFFQLYVVNSLRSANAQFTFPAILYSIFVNVGMTSGRSFTTMTAAKSFVKLLMSAFLLGLAISTGVSLFVFPINSRTVIFKQMVGYLQKCRGLLKAQTRYMESLEAQNMFRAPTAKSHAEALEHQAQGIKSVSSPEAIALKQVVAALRALHGKIAADITFAKREIAFGKLGPSDISELHKLMRQIFLPLGGASSLIDIFQRIAEEYGWDKPKAIDEEKNETQWKEKASADWQEVMQALHEPFAQISHDMDEALEHVLLTLEFVKPTKKKGQNQEGFAETSDDDIEAQSGTVKPGHRLFAEYYDRKTQEFYAARVTTLRNWAVQKGISLPPSIIEIEIDPPKIEDGGVDSYKQRDQRQLLVLLYMEYLLWAASRSVLQLVNFADSKVNDGTMKKRRLLLPGYHRLKKWFWSIFNIPKSNSNEENDVMANIEAGNTVRMGDAFHGRRDPEHLSPRSAFEKFGEYLRILPHALRSHHSMFGFRVAVATMSIGITAYLKNSSTFFNEQRLVWAMNMIAISMTRTSGQSLFNFFLRTLGTTIAVCASLVIYYMVDGKTAGVLVFAYIWICLSFYVVLKIPKYVIIGIISSISVILILGYELQVRKIGLKLATSNGQRYYPIYLLGPYRLACVAGGLFVAFFWTIFPYPVSDHSELRKDVATSLYLLASHDAVTIETINSRIRGDEGNLALKESPGRQLEKVRQRVFAEQAQLLNKMKSSSDFSKWELTVGGRFPKEIYDKSIALIERIMSYSALMSYTSRSFLEKGENQAAWQENFRAMISSASTTSHEIVSILGLLASSVSTGNPLPPYLKLPEPYHLLRRLVALDRDILGVSHVAEPGYAAFAVIQIASKNIISDVCELTNEVKKLVGELDFSYRIIDPGSIDLKKEAKLD